MAVPTLDVDGPRATIALRRPDKRNRIEPDDIVELLALCDRIDGDDGVRVVVLRADGPSFCAGYHLGALAEGGRTDASFSDLCDRIEAVRVPVIAAIGGNVHGGGTDLALACDLRIAGSGIHLLMPAAKLGIQYYGTGLRRFVDRIGPGATTRIFCTGLPVETDELLRMGYLTEVVPEAELDARVDEIASAVAALAPGAVAATKAAINGLAAGTIDVAQVEAGHRASLASAEHRSALAALRADRQR